ncbi:MAG: endonuclease V [Phycisphaerae bacterium]|nr:endonuclease V [Phycisphaerae bacterium]
MKLPRAPHRWRVTPARAIRIQKELTGRVVQAPLPASARWIAGADMAFSSDGRRCIAGVVLWDRQLRQVVEERLATRDVTFPYVPGLLSFREAPAVLAALRGLRRIPDVLVLDGQGLAHPRRMGLACHVGLLADIPTVGCAKSRLCGSGPEPGARRGSRSALVDGDEVIGAMVRTRDGVRCVYVSVGHRATLDEAITLVTGCCTRFRLPEPTRLAHQLVTRHRVGL